MTINIHIYLYTFIAGIVMLNQVQFVCQETYGEDSQWTGSYNAPLSLIHYLIKRIREGNGISEKYPRLNRIMPVLDQRYNILTNIHPVLLSDMTLTSHVHLWHFKPATTGKATHQSSTLLAHCEGNPPMTARFPYNIFTTWISLLPTDMIFTLSNQNVRCHWLTSQPNHISITFISH